MERKQFISLVGKGAASALFLACLEACTKSTVAPSNAKVDFTIDISSSQYSNLNTVGGYVYVNNIIIAKATNGQLIAVSAVCTHAGSYVEYTTSNNSFFCPTHGSDFATNGAVLNGPASIPLQQFKVSQSGSTIRIYS